VACAIIATTYENGGPALYKDFPTQVISAEICNPLMDGRNSSNLLRGWLPCDKLGENKEKQEEK